MWLVISLRKIFNKILEKLIEVFFCFLRSLLKLISRVLTFVFKMWLRIKDLIYFIKFGAITLISTYAVYFVYQPEAQQALSKSTILADIFIGVGALLGSVIAIVLTLSIIPIQRAAEAFTPSIIRIYKTDRINESVIIILSIFCLASFLMAVGNSIGLRQEQLLLVLILIIGISFDLLRFYNKRINTFLEPHYPIEYFKQLTFSIITYSTSRARILALIQWWTMYPRSGSENRKLLEKAIYDNLRVDYLVREYSAEVAEIASKAISNGELNVARMAVEALNEIACNYLKKRKDNLILKRSYLCIECDGDIVLEHIYDQLDSLNKLAVSEKAEMVSRYIVRAYESIVVFTININGNTMRYITAPISWKPLGYLSSCVRDAQASQMDNVGLEGSKAYLKIGFKVIDSVCETSSDPRQIINSIIANWNEVMQSYAVAGKHHLINEPAQNMMTFAMYNLKTARDINIIRDILNGLKDVFPIALLSQSVNGPPAFGVSSPLSAPYNLLYTNSIAFWVELAASWITESDPENKEECINDFIKLNEVIYQHLRTLAETFDLSRSELPWFITNTIESICDIYLAMLQREEIDIISKQKFRGQVRWYLAFLWAKYKKASFVSCYEATHTSTILAKIALAYVVINVPEVAETSISNMLSITNFYNKLAEKPTLQDILKVLEPITHVKLAAEKIGDSNTQKVLEKLAKPDSFSNEVWIEVQKALEEKERRLRIELEEEPFNEDDLFDAGTSLGILKKIWSIN